MNIIPAILPKNRKDLVQKLQQLVGAGYSGRIQIDLCDGVFVPSITWPFAEFGDRESFIQNADTFELDTELSELLDHFEIEYDIMVADPEHLFSVWDLLQPNRIVFHLDSVSDPEALTLDLSAQPSPFEVVKNHQVILAVSQTTDLQELFDWYHDVGIRQVQVMGISVIGKQGELFNKNTLSILETIQKKYPDMVLQVDGGVNSDSISLIHNQGVTTVIAGSAVFADGAIMDNISTLEKCAIL